jgi:hypothetical protein
MPRTWIAVVAVTSMFGGCGNSESGPYPGQGEPKTISQVREVWNAKSMTIIDAYGEDAVGGGIEIAADVDSPKPTDSAFGIAIYLSSGDPPDQDQSYKGIPIDVEVSGPFKAQ